MEKIKERLRWQGKVIIEKFNNKKLISKKTIFNMITNNALNEIIKSLYNYPNMKLEYLAIGDDNTAVSASDVQLGNEIFRTPIITQSVTGTGELTSRAILLPDEPFAAPSPPSHDQCIIREIGFFAGTNAEEWNDGTGANTGLLISRIVLSSPETKADNEQINFTRVDSIER